MKPFFEDLNVRIEKFDRGDWFFRKAMMVGLAFLTLKFDTHRACMKWRLVEKQRGSVVEEKSQTGYTSVLCDQCIRTLTIQRDNESSLIQRFGEEMIEEFTYNVTYVKYIFDK